MTTKHPAHGPVSLDRLHQICEILSKAAAQSDGGNLGYAMADAVKVIDGAIAAFGAEPVGEVVLGEYDDCGSYPDARVVCIAADGHADWENFKDGTLLYSVTPAPLSIDERAAFNYWNNDENLPIAGVGAKNAAWLAWQARAKFGSPPAPVASGFVPSELTREEYRRRFMMEDNFDDTYRGGWNACRAAMLKAGNHTEKHLDMVVHSGDDNEKADCRLPFDQWLSQQNDPIDVDCGCVTTEAFYYWLRVAYEAGNSPVTADGLALVPKRLTAENGAKSALSGEFSETKFINCPECFGDDDCETCDGSGRIEITVPVTWTTIKAIWAKGVEHFEAAPQQDVKSALEHGMQRYSGAMQKLSEGDK